MGDEKSQCAEAHFDFFKIFIEEVDFRSISDMDAVIGDNCAISRALSRNFESRFTCCYIHRFNLAVKDLLQRHSARIEIIQLVMHKLSFKTLVAKLCHKTNLVAIKCSETRPSSTYSILQQYQKVLEFIDDVCFPELKLLQLSDRQNGNVDSFIGQFANLDSVTVILQKSSISLASGRTLFNGVLENFREFENCLAFTVVVVKKPTFEKAVIKVQQFGVRANST